MTSHRQTNPLLPATSRSATRQWRPRRVRPLTSAYDAPHAPRAGPTATATARALAWAGWRNHESTAPLLVCPRFLACRCRGSRSSWRLLTEKSGDSLRVGIFRDFVRLTTRTMHTHGAYAWWAQQSRIGPHWGEAERPTTRTLAAVEGLAELDGVDVDRVGVVGGRVRRRVAEPVSARSARGQPTRSAHAASPRVGGTRVSAPSGAISTWAARGAGARAAPVHTAGQHRAGQHRAGQHRAD